MRLLAYTHDAGERSRIVDLMERHGIPVFYDAGSWSLRNPTRGALFVCINEQYADAIALLADETHEVRQPVDVDAFKNDIRTVGLSRTLKGALIALLVVALAWAGALALLA